MHADLCWQAALRARGAARRRDRQLVGDLRRRISVPLPPYSQCVAPDVALCRRWRNLVAQRHLLDKFTVHSVASWCLGRVRHEDGTLVQPWRSPRRAIRVEGGCAVPFQHVRDACGVPAADCIRPFGLRPDHYSRPCAPASPDPCSAPGHHGGADAGDNASRPVPHIPASCRSPRNGRQPTAGARGLSACAGCNVAGRAITCNKRGSPRR
jgi:hypothetical protein